MTASQRFILIAALLLLWATRITDLESLPLHNDEGLHLTRAVEVWNGHPFWNISDGKIVNHWLIAAFYPQHAPVFVSRIATVFIAMIGLAAGIALARRITGAVGACLAAVLWLTAPYLFFYERLAFSDAQAGAWVVVSFYLALRLAHGSRQCDAVLTGLASAAAMLFKFTAAPFALGTAVIVLSCGRAPLRRKTMLLLIAALVTVLCFLPPLLYVMLRGDDFFSIALGWIGAGGSATGELSFIANTARLWAQLTGYGSLAWSATLLGGLAVLIVTPAGRRRSVILAAAMLPLAIMMIFGREVLPRHYVVALPLALTLGGCGLAILIRHLDEAREKWAFAGLICIVLTAAMLPFMIVAYRAPGTLPLPDEERSQFVRDHSGGFGLREAVQSFPATITRPLTPIIGSMFPDSCRRANFYSQGGQTMICTDAPGLAHVEQALDESGAVYVLADSAPLIGLDPAMINTARATRIAVYPRPGETEQTASVVLWLLER